jgi:uncharacterized protein with HEPN domain
MISFTVTTCGTTRRKRLLSLLAKTRAEFDADEVLRLALTYLIQIVGEAASQISQETKDAHPEIQWHSIVGMRHRIVHGYFCRRR